MGRVYIPALKPYLLAIQFQKEMRSAISKGAFSSQLYSDSIAQVEIYVDAGFYHAAKSVIRDLAELSERTEAVIIAKEIMLLSNMEAERFFDYYIEYVEDAYRVEAILRKDTEQEVI